VCKRAAASSSHPFLSSAPPHEYTQSAFTGATACGNAAAASPLFSFSPSPPPLGSSALPQHYMLRSPPQEYALGRQCSSRVDSIFPFAGASFHRVRDRNSRVAVASLRLLGAAFSTYYRNSKRADGFS
jgi:hypothetical protein